jgi:hypothetical protein
VTLAELIEKLTAIAREHRKLKAADVFLMGSPTVSDEQRPIENVYEWDGCIVIEANEESE